MSTGARSVSEVAATDDLPEQHRVVVDQVRAAIYWYQVRKRRARRLHWTVTAATLAIGATIPVLSLGESIATRYAIAIAGTAVTMLTGFAAAYRWDTSWRTFTYAQQNLEVALIKWRLEFASSGSAPNGPERLGEATAQLLSTYAETMRLEAQNFFAGLTGSASAESPSPPSA